MKNQKGFIQIPLLIAIIAGVLVVGGASYFGVKQYQNYQIEKERSATEQKQNEEIKNNPQNSEIEKLRQEVEELKKSQTKTEQARPSSEKTFSTTQIVSQNKKFIVSIVCSTGSGSVFGSGVIIGKSQNNLIILTNYHVTKYAKTLSAGISPCVVSDSGLGEYYYGQPIYFPSMISQSEYVSLSQQQALINEMDAIDFSFVEIKEPIQGETMYYDETTGKYISQPFIPKTSLLSTTIFPKICSQNLLKAGEEIVVLGYPMIGGDSVLPGVPNLKLITTEGIISNDVSNFDNYFVSSAKIEQGNSGGGAFLKSGNCFAGMPTYVQVGEIESLGRLINIPKLKENYLSKIFSNL